MTEKTWLDLTDEDTALIMFSGGIESACAAYNAITNTNAKVYLATIVGPHYFQRHHWANGVLGLRDQMERYIRRPIDIIEFHSSEWPIMPSISFFYHFMAAQIIRDPRYNITHWIKTAQYLDEKSKLREPHSMAIFKEALWCDIRQDYTPVTVLEPYKGVPKDEVIADVPPEIWHWAVSCIQPVAMPNALPPFSTDCGECVKCKEKEEALKKIGIRKQNA